MASRTVVNFNSPLLIYQRHRERIEDALVAVGLAALVGIFLSATGVFSEAWRLVLMLALVGVGSFSRFWGYNAAVAVLAWPIWTLAPILLVPFLAAALLPRRWIVAALPWVLLVASAPLLAQWQIVGLAPLLAGLVAGRTSALVVGVFAALWLAVAGGLAGWQPELGALHGAPLSPPAVEAYLSGASFTGALRLLVAPFTESHLLLLVQVLAWGVAGWGVATVREMTWQDGTPQLPLVPALATGAVVLWAAIFLLPVWFDRQSFWALVAAPTPTVGLALSAVLAALLGTLIQSVHQPVARPRRGPAAPRPKRRMSREGMRPAMDAPPATARRHPWAEIPRPEDDETAPLDVR